jgi:hypothetical protein
MKQINLRGAIATRAAQIAARELKQKLRATDAERPTNECTGSVARLATCCASTPKFWKGHEQTSSASVR